MPRCLFVDINGTVHTLGIAQTLYDTSGLIAPGTELCHQFQIRAADDHPAVQMKTAVQKGLPHHAVLQVGTDVKCLIQHP